MLLIIAKRSYKKKKFCQTNYYKKGRMIIVMEKIKKIKNGEIPTR
jgi:hypothetical protein